MNRQVIWLGNVTVEIGVKNPERRKYSGVSMVGANETEILQDQFELNKSAVRRWLGKSSKKTWRIVGVELISKIGHTSWPGN